MSGRPRARTLVVDDVDATTVSVHTNRWRAVFGDGFMSHTIVSFGPDERYEPALVDLHIAGVDVPRQLAELRRIGERLIAEAARAGHRHRTRLRTELLAAALAATERPVGVDVGAAA